MQIATPIYGRSVENPSVPLSAVMSDSGDVWDSLTGGESSAAGVKVTRTRAMGYSAIWRGVNLIAGDVGRLAVRVMKRQGKGKELAPDHPAYRLVRRKPNAYMTAFTFRQVIQAHALLEGNGYAWINRLGSRPTELLILDPTQTYPVRVNGELFYTTRVSTGDRATGRDTVVIGAPDVLHVRGLGFDGLCGYPVLQILRDTIGGALAARDYGTRFFRNDAKPGFVLEVPVGMPETAVKNLRDSWERLHKGVNNAHRTGILRDGVKLQQITKNARDAQLIENREFDAREIANVIGVPPHKVGDPSRTAYNSLEAENQAYYDDTLDRWLICWEEELADKLLTEAEKDGDTHTIEFARAELMRVNLAARGAYYVQGLTSGWLNADEVRAYENLNPIPDGLGETYYRPANVFPAGEEPEPEPAPAPEPTPEPEPEPTPPDQEAMRAALRAGVADVLTRMARRLATHAERAAKKGARDLTRFLDTFEAEHRDTVEESLAPFASVRGAARFGGPDRGEFAGLFLDLFRLQVAAAIEDAADLPAAVAQSCERFEAFARDSSPKEFCP